MTMTKMFIETFTPTMEQNGFRRKGHLFWRVKGEILQGIVLKNTNPFGVCFAFYPLWMHNLIHSGPTGAFEKGYWAEGPYFNENSHYYYRKETMDENRAAFERCQRTAEIDVIPFLDHVDTFEEYWRILAAVSLKDKEAFDSAKVFSYRQDLTGSPMVFTQCLNNYDLLWRAYMDGNFDRAADVLAGTKAIEREQVIQACEDYRKDMKRIEQELMDMIPDFALTEPSLEEQLASKEQSFRRRFALFYEKQDQNNLEWIRTVYERETEEMRRLLKLS